MTKRSLKPSDPHPTPEQQQNAFDTLVLMALLDPPLNVAAVQQLGSLPREAGLYVAEVLLTLAAAAVQDTKDWQDLLQQHLALSAPQDIAQ